MEDGIVYSQSDTEKKNQGLHVDKIVNLFNLLPQLHISKTPIARNFDKHTEKVSVYTLAAPYFVLSLMYFSFIQRKGIL